MTNQELKDSIAKLEPTATIEEGKQYINVSVAPQKWYNLAKGLKESKELAFDYLFNLTGVDYGDTLGVVYHLESTTYHHVVVIKVATDRQNPQIPTICDIWKTAEFHEREAFDFLGINFTNHPDLRRIFLDEEWSGYPLRKDYDNAANVKF
ncbi:MAG TPA: NADH-quinone oxidoreductase chain 5 [Bacteroidales bacterium]|nr:NADH-quinone oxidoreductase chain 5 [Bacteroidales bacterium]